MDVCVIAGWFGVTDCLVVMLIGLFVFVGVLDDLV